MTGRRPLRDGGRERGRDGGERGRDGGERGPDGGPPIHETGNTGPTILVIDNYDSFVYNLVQAIGPHAGAVAVRRNDSIDPEGIRAIDPDGIVVSPGPGTPQQAGVSMSLFDLDYPTLGVCLGHQALCAANDAEVGHAEHVVHGKPSTVRHDGRGIFDGLPEAVEVGRYHSLAVSREGLPDVLEEAAWATDEDVVMAVRHRDRPHVGVQFHPESILTPHGPTMIRRFVETCTTT